MCVIEIAQSRLCLYTIKLLCSLCSRTTACGNKQDESKESCIAKDSLLSRTPHAAGGVPARTGKGGAKINRLFSPEEAVTLIFNSAADFNLIARLSKI
jgi:hypothetical protein